VVILSNPPAFSKGLSPFESDAGAFPGGSEEHMDFKLTIFSDYI